MKWFQQHTNALYDPKIVKLIKQHGIRGYGIYHGINILIAEHDAENLTLEHDIEGLQSIFNDQDIQPVIETCLSLGLLTHSTNQLQNLKISKYVGNWQKRKQPTEALQRPYVEPTAKKEGKKEGSDLKKDLDVKGFFQEKSKNRKKQDEAAIDKFFPSGIEGLTPTKLGAIAKQNDIKSFMRGKTEEQLKRELDS